MGEGGSVEGENNAELELFSASSSSFALFSFSAAKGHGCLAGCCMAERGLLNERCAGETALLKLSVLFISRKRPFWLRDKKTKSQIPRIAFFFSRALFTPRLFCAIFSLGSMKRKRAILLAGETETLGGKRMANAV